MNFKTVKTEDGKHYVWLKDVSLGQGLLALYSVEDKKIMVLDPDSKDYTGKEYDKKLKLEEKEYGIVQEISSEAIMELAELMKILRTLG